MSDDIETDISVIASFEHPNIAPYESFFFTKLQSKKYLGLVRPYFKSNVTEVANFKKFTAVDCEICDKLIKALAYIHDKYSTVLNLKKSNVFIDSSGEVILTDIAIPILLNEDLQKKEDNIQLSMYSPPEMKDELMGLNSKCDIWNLGILFYELYKKAHPFDAATAKEASKHIKKGFVAVEMENGILDEMITECLQSKPEKRPGLASIKRRLTALIRSQNIDFEEADARRFSYGLVSPNKDLNAQSHVADSNTEKLDASDDGREPQQENADPNFFEKINPDVFSSKISSEIVYNDNNDGASTDKKAKFR